MSVFRIIVLTDLHLPKNITDIYKGVNCWDVLESTLPKIIEQKPDLLVLSGDVACYFEDKVIYERLKNKLDSYKIPYRVLKGNHDRGGALKEVFGLFARTDSFYQEQIKGVKLTFFDTSEIEPDNSGLENLSRSLSFERSLVFSHYHPLNVGHKLFDETYPLLWKKELFNVLKNANFKTYYFFGHIHFEFYKNLGNLKLYSTPSLSLPIDKNKSDFTLLDNKGFYRIIDIENDKINTFVKHTL